MKHRSSLRPQEPVLSPDPPHSLAGHPPTQVGFAATCTSILTPGQTRQHNRRTHSPGSLGPLPPDVISSRAISRPVLA